MRPMNLYRTFTDEPYLPRNRGNTGTLAQSQHEAGAQLGSQALREAIESSIFRWGFKHGIRPDQAQALLMDWRMVG